MEIVGIGTSICECLRIARMIERYGELFLTRVFTPAEVQYCQSRTRAIQQFTANWAAKEAVVRAIGADKLRPIHWREIEIRSKGNGQATVAVGGNVREIVERLRAAKIVVSFSYCHTHAMATAIVLRE